jgi:hypothetical protein
MRGIRWALLGLAGLAIGCESVPDLTFADAGDAASEPDGPAGDGAPGCPGPNPPDGAALCCGTIPCQGQCAGRCPDCMNCLPGELCCARQNNVQCLLPGHACQ